MFHLLCSLAFFSIFAQFVFAVDNQELKNILAGNVKNSNFKPYIEQSSNGLVHLFIFNPSSSNSSTETALIKNAINYASKVAAPYGKNLMDIKKSSFPKVKNFSVYVLRKSQTDPAVLNMIGATAGGVRAITSYPPSADSFRVFVFIDDSPYNPNADKKFSQSEFLLETTINFIHEAYGHAFEIIKDPRVAKQSYGEQEVKAYLVQLDGLVKLKQRHYGVFDSSTQKLLDAYIEDTKAKIDYFKNNSY